MTKKNILLFIMVTVGFVATNVMTMENQRLDWDHIAWYRWEKNNGKKQVLDDAVIILLYGNECIDEITTFEKASERVFNRLKLFGYDQCPGLLNGVPLLVSRDNYHLHLEDCTRDVNMMLGVKPPIGLERNRRIKACKLAEAYYKRGL